MGKALARLLNKAMRAERAAFLGAVPNERTTERVGHANGCETTISPQVAREDARSATIGRGARPRYLSQEQPSPIGVEHTIRENDSRTNRE